MKYRLFAFAAAVLTAISAMPYISAVAEETATNGSLSDNISWDYSVEDGVLTITGTGAVPAGEMGWADLKAHSSSWTYIDEDGNEQVHVSIHSFSFTDKPASVAECCNEQWRDLIPEIRTLVIGEGVTEIAASAFCGLTALEAVTLPDSLTAIGDYAFANCAKLTRPELPEALRKKCSNSRPKPKLTCRSCTKRFRRQRRYSMAVCRS